MNKMYREILENAIIGNVLISSNCYERGSGKTSTLIEMSYNLDIPLVVANETMRRTVLAHSETMQKPIEVKVPSECVRDGLAPVKYLLDEGIRKVDIDKMREMNRIFGGLYNPPTPVIDVKPLTVLTPKVANFTITMESFIMDFGIHPNAVLLSAEIAEEDVIEIVFGLSAYKPPTNSWSCGSLKNTRRTPLMKMYAKEEENQQYAHKELGIYRTKKSLRIEDINEFLGIKEDSLVLSVNHNVLNNKVDFSILASVDENKINTLFSSANPALATINSFVKFKGEFS